MQKNYPAIITINLNNVFRKFIIVIIWSSFFCNVIAQNSMVGDGFGGRLWYKPYNYSTGAYSAYTICGDSAQLYGWGDNEYGQLGNGSYLHSATPIKVTGMTNAMYYSTGYIMGAIKKNKTGWVWGQFAGNKPIKIIDKVKFLDAGMTVCTFVKTDGTVWSVGSNSTGSFGNGMRADSNIIVPQKMLGIITAVRVANSGRNNIILLSDGTVMSAGINFNNTNSFVPRQIKGLEKIIDIKANKRCIVALDQNGNVYTWGDGHFGSLGNGNTNSSDIPEKIISLKNIVAISGCNDGEHFLALDSNQNCYSWGYNGYGQCGVKDTEVISTPKLIERNVVDIMAGERFSYIVKKDGGLWASGMSKGGSIWMNSNNTRKYQFTALNPNILPMNMCKTEHLATKIYVFKKLLLCKGDSFRIAGKYYNSAGNYQDTLLKDTCMDTISTIQITFNKVLDRYLHVYLCSGESTSVGKNIYLNSGEYKDTFSSYKGCDSIIHTTVTILPLSSFSQAISLCEGGRYPIGQHIYDVSGIYTDTLSNYRGCDSIVTTTLHIKAKPFSHKIFTITCGEKLVTSKGSYSSSCRFNDTFISYSGCDSIVFNSLFVISKTMFKQTQTICSGESFRIGKHNYTHSGFYLDTLRTMQGCDSVVSTTLIVNTAPVADFTYSSTTKCTDDSFLLTNTSVLANQYLWRFGPSGKDTSSLTHLQLMFRSDGIKYIHLTAINSNTGCSDSIAKPIEIIDNTNVYIPNAFTPNNDQINDLFYPFSRNYDRLKMQIFNRWGELLFQTNEWNKGWDGNYNLIECPQEVYMYIIELTNTAYHKTKVFKGTLTLLR